LADSISPDELEEVRRLVKLGLPPVASRFVLAAIFGINPGLVWSFESRTHRHYRRFSLPKGNNRRWIDAPRVGLKIVQKWLSVQFQKCYSPPEHVYGFVASRSHVQAAAKHCGAKWIFSVDIKDFFQSTTKAVVISSLETMGYGSDSARLLASLCCLRGMLVQGAPSSPVLSNICFQSLDKQLAEIAHRYEVRLTRYADDIVFSGTGLFLETLREEVVSLFNGEPWHLAEQKTHFSKYPNRLKVHGLLVHGEYVRLTKGYRNRLRAFRHLLASGKINNADISKIKGHLIYGSFIDRENPIKAI